MGIMHLCMRTTLDLDGQILSAARQRAAAEGKTLTAFVETALAAALAPRAVSGTKYRLRWKTHGGKLLPGIDLDDRDSLLDEMEDRR